MTVLDWIVVVTYFAVVVYIALARKNRIDGLREYFLAGRSLSVWAVTLSIIATETSAATFVGGPDTAYRGNIAYLQTLIGTFLSRLFLAYFVIEIFYKAKVYTVYAYLETTFGREARLFASSLFLFGRLLASAARLFIAAFALAIIIGMPITTAIMAIAVLAIFYSVLGGLRAVVVTDIFQGLLFLATGIVGLVFIVSSSGGLGVVFEQLQSSSKFVLFDGEIDFFSKAFWASPYTLLGAVIGAFTLGVATHGTDQEMVQRMLACRSGRDSRRTLILAGLLEIPVALLFVTLGLALWAFFTIHGGGPAENESVLPFFIREFVPTGLRGLLVAGILAAAMSSLDSTLTALSSVVVTDFDKSHETSGVVLKNARRWSVFWGLMLCGLACIFAEYYTTVLEQLSGQADPTRQTELLTLALGVMAILYGPLLSMFVLALFTKRGSTLSIIAGTLTSITAVAIIAYGKLVQIGWTWHIVIGFLIAFAIGITTSRARQHRP